MMRHGEPDERELQAQTRLVRLVSLLLAAAGFSLALMIAGQSGG
jgi:hypothetical protein